MTQLKNGNISELWKLSSPMMVSFFSMVLMMFVDRLYLSMYSTEALNGAVQAGTLAWAFFLFFITMGAMSEVFVSQYNGANKLSKLGEPVWQMLWFTGFSVIFFTTFSLFFTKFIYSPINSPHEYEYFKYCMLFGPASTMLTSVGGFFIGRGKTQIMQWLGILGNAINICLDPIFIFGIPGYFPELGAKGAAIATGIGTIVQAGIIFYLFLRKKNRKKYGTLNWHFNKPLFMKTIKVGLPPSIFCAVEIAAWAAFYFMMAQISNVHILVASVVQSILLLFLFFGMGLEKGVIAHAGNLIGAKLSHKIPKVMKSALCLNLLFLAFSSFFLLFKPMILIDWFYSNPKAIDATLSLANIDLAHVKHLTRIGLAMTLFYIFFENARWAVNGILTAAGDTMFLLIAGACSIWFFMLVPTYFLVIVPKASIKVAFYIWAFYAAAAFSINYLRFLSGKWKKSELTEGLEGKIKTTVEEQVSQQTMSTSETIEQ